MNRTVWLVPIVLLFAFGQVAAQGIGTWGENTDQWQSPKAGTPWASPESLFIGATFLRDTTKPFVVWLKFNQAVCSGDLYLVVPGGKVGGGDTTIYLFNNHDPYGTTVNLTNLPVVRNNVHHMDTIWFMYYGRNSCPENRRYSGPNRAPGDGYTGTDRFYSVDQSTSTFTSPDGSTHQIGRRWCVAGWVRNYALNARTDTVEFGFEDLLPGDADYDDVLFRVTGVFLIRPASIVDITLDAQPAADTIQAGQTVTYTATVWVDSTDNNGIHYTFADPARSGMVTWQIIGDATGGSLSGGAGPVRANTFTGTRAYKLYTIRATITDPKTGQIMTRNMTVYVRPAAAHHLVIEGAVPTITPAFNLNADAPVNSITLPATVTRDTVYAVLRDLYGNFVSTCAGAAWNEYTTPDLVTATGTSGRQFEGIIVKLGPSGTAKVEARDATRPTLALFRDTIDVIVSPVSYTALRFANGMGGAKTVITSLEINLTEDTLIYAEALRSDGIGGDQGNGWVRVRVPWQLIPNPNTLYSSTTAPNPDSVWNFAPITDTGRGIIRITQGSLTANLNVRVKTGGPARITLYSQLGTPGAGGNDPYLSANPPVSYTYTITAGVPFPMVGKIFDPYGIWLSGYETDPALGVYISWESRYRRNGAAVPVASGRYNTGTGPSVNYTAYDAYDTLDLIATFNRAPWLYRDTVRVRVVPAGVFAIYIEPTPDSSISLRDPNPIDVVTMQNSATTLNVYGMLRDRFGNYIKHADSAAWASLDPSVVTAAMGTQWQLGQGLISRVASVQDTTFVTAQYNPSGNGPKDSVMVVISAVTYDSLRVYVLSGGKRFIDSLVIRTDQDTTLYTEGKRSDTKVWELVASTWTAPGLTPSTGPTATSWRFVPTSPATGRIIASRAGTSGTIRDTVRVTVLPGLAVTMNLYSRTGAPAPTDPGNAPYPDQTVVDTMAAGQSRTIVAKLFDNRSVWLSAYESAPKNQTISWNITESPSNATTPTGTLSLTSGHQTVFTPTRAWNTVTITSTYNEDGRQLTRAVRIYVKPAEASRLVIEPAPSPTGAYLHTANELGTVSFTSTDTLKFAYAILRDPYGNFVSNSLATTWSSADATVADAREGNAANGEGVVIRMARQGTTQAIAVSGTYPNLRDTVAVNLQAISYTALRIVVGDSTRISNLVMSIDDDTSIVVQGRRSDNGRWENVPGNWSATSGLSTTPGAPTSSDIWAFSPNDTGSGTITASLAGQNASITARFTVGAPASMVLYPDTGIATASNAPYAPPSQEVIDTAGRALQLVAKVFDYRNNWLRSYEIGSAPVSWSVVELEGNPPTGTLAPTSGHLSVFTGIRAYNTVYVIAVFSEGGRQYIDTVKVRVVAGRANHLVIEANQNWQASPNADNPVDTVQISSRETFRSVYAILRDSLQNYVSYSTATLWRSGDTALVSVTEGTPLIGEGSIQRVGAQGVTTVSASNRTTPTLTDNVAVRVVAYYYTQLRIVNAAGQPVDSISVLTDDSTTLRVQGLRSDDTTGTRWENVDARWENSGALTMTPTAPERDKIWTFSPDAPGTGIIRVTMGADTVTLPDTIRVTFVRSNPSGVEIEILTPPDQRIAGDTIVAVVRVRNKDGLLPGSYCANAVHQDTLGASPSGDSATVTDGRDTVNVNVRPLEVTQLNQCFEDGVDTVRYVLTNAPADPDSTHKLWVKINGVWGTTPPFVLYPAALERLVLENVAGNMVPDTVTYQYSDIPPVWFARGYDRFGNARGPELSDWSAGGTLHPIPGRTTSIARIYYEIASITEHEQGMVAAIAVDTSNGVRGDSVYVILMGPPTRYMGSVTRDYNGNGYLDAIEVSFSRPVTLPADENERALLLDGIYVDGQSISFQPWEIIGMNGTLTDTVFVVRLREDTTRGEPQTAWTPEVSFEPGWMAGTLGGLPEPLSGVTAEDGAGPVVWEVIKYIEEGKLDRVVVVMSEPVNAAAGGALGLSTAPEALFDVYRWNAITRSYVLDTAMLDSITQLTKVSGDTIEFVMTNKADLVIGYWFTLDQPSLVVDVRTPPNLPMDTTRFAPVRNEGKVGLDLKSVPNPAAASARPGHVPGQLSAAHDDGARDWVLARNEGGVLTTFTLTATGTVRVLVRIYDLAGNLVAWDDEPDALAGRPRDGSTVNHDIWWDGFNARGVPVASGVYRQYVYVYYEDSKKELKEYINLGIVKTKKQ